MEIGIFNEFKLMKEKVKRYEDTFAPWTEELDKQKAVVHEQCKEILELQDKLDDSTRNAAALKVNNGVLLKRTAELNFRLAGSEAEVLRLKQEDNTELKKKIARQEKSIINHCDLYNNEVQSVRDAREELDKERKENKRLTGKLADCCSNNDFLAAAQNADGQVNRYRDLYIKANKENAEFRDQVLGLKNAVISYRDHYENTFFNLRELEKKHVKQRKLLDSVVDKVHEAVKHAMRVST